MSETLTWANPIETEKIRTHHAKIVVECTTGKPYYSIEWFEPSKQEYYLGYSSCNIDNVLGWLSECFEIVEAPTTNADRIRAMSDEELAEFLCEINGCYQVNCPGKERCNFGDGKSNGLKKWLKQPAEVDNG